MTTKILLFLIIGLISLKEHVRANTATPARELQVKEEFIATACNESCSHFNVYKHLFEEMNSPNHPRIQVYYNRIVQKLYETQPAHVLFLQLWQIYRKCDPSTFVVMVRAQLSLFWLHNMNEDPDYDYLLMVANGLYKIKNYFLYPSLNSRTQILFKRAIKSLPNSLHYLFGHQEFCLMNRRHQEMLYQTNSSEFAANQEVHFGFTWHFMQRYNDGLGKITPIFGQFNVTDLIAKEGVGEEEEGQYEEDMEHGDSSSDLGSIPACLSVALFSRQFQNFYCRWPDYDHKIGGNFTDISELNWQHQYHLWSVKLVDDDQFVFYQNQYTMCATTFYDNKRRFVLALKNRSPDDTECQWSAGKCDRR